MAQVQMNVRVDDQLKARVDRILARRDISTTEAVRGLWQYVAEHEDLPKEVADIIRPDREAEKRRRIKAAKESAGLAARLAKETMGIELKPLTVEEMKQMIDDERWERYQEHLAERSSR